MSSSEPTSQTFYSQQSTKGHPVTKAQWAISYLKKAQVTSTPKKPRTSSHLYTRGAGSLYPVEPASGCSGGGLCEEVLISPWVPIHRALVLRRRSLSWPGVQLLASSCVCTMRVQCPWRPADSIRSPGPGVTDNCKWPCECWDQSPVFWESSQCPQSLSCHL